MHIALHAAQRPDDPAIVMDDGTGLNFRQLDQGSVALANRFHALGLRAGGVKAEPIAYCRERIAHYKKSGPGGIRYPPDAPAQRQTAQAADQDALCSRRGCARLKVE